MILKERLNLTPHLREIDVRIEKIELSIRELILNELGPEESNIPQHILQKVTDRVSRAIKKNSSIDLEDLKSLSEKLEYFDLTELQQTITNKKIWNEFSSVFRTKEELDKRFSQLAELRNSIRHSRSVTNIVEKDGEAAILWFETIL